MASRRGLAAFEPGLWAHYAAAIVAAWFFMSSLVWHDGRLLRSLDWILGLLAVGAAVWSLRESRRHWWISGLGAVILLLGAISPHTRELSAWNERIVGSVLVLLGLVAGGQLPPQDT